MKFPIFQSLAVFGATLVATAPARAQQPQKLLPPAPAAASSEQKILEIPADKRPPKGMCRIWLLGIVAEHQPAVSDCATALKNKPLPDKGRVIFGDDYVDIDKKPAETIEPVPSSKSTVLPPVVPLKKPPT